MLLKFYFSSSSVVSRTFSALCALSARCALCAYSTIWALCSPLGYHCDKLCFCRTLHCLASPWGRIAYSITQSLNQSPSLFDSTGTEAFASELLFRVLLFHDVSCSIFKCVRMRLQIFHFKKYPRLISKYQCKRRRPFLEPIYSTACNAP